MDPIRVLLGPDPTSYDTATKAIEAVKRSPRQPRAKSDGLLLAGRKFLGGRWSLSHWSLAFSGGVWLDLVASNYEVTWEVRYSRPAFERQSEPYFILWPSSEVTQLSPDDLFADRIEAEFWQLYVIDRGLGIYFRRRKSLHLQAIANADNGESLFCAYELE